MKFYRYEAYQQGEHFPNTMLRLVEFNLHKETPKGYWIGYGHNEPGQLRSDSRWVSKNGRKRYAYPTKEEAMNNFILRKQREIKILKARLMYSEDALTVAQLHLNQNDTISATN